MTKQSLKQPKALYYLFIVEMWERFSYYGMRAILVLYMTKMLLLGDTKSYLIYGTFTALVYMFPVIGGYLADKYIGYIRAVIIGGCVIIAGHISLALPFTISLLGDKFFFFLGLSLLVVGTGFFKSNVSSIVGTLYKKNDPRRDGGFTIFYMGINLGSFIATIAVAFVADYFGWHCGFSLAAIGMVFGLITFITGYKKGVFPSMANKLNTNRLTNILIFVGSIGILVVSSILISNPGSTQSIILIFGALVLLYIIYELIRANNHERAGILMILILSFISMFFFAFFEQAGSSITLFTDRNVDRSLFGFNIPSAAFVSLNPMFILLLSPFISKIWLKLSQKNLDPSAIVKFAMGMLFMSLGFGALAMGAKISISAVTSSMIWVILGYFFQTVGELTLSPVGLSAVTKYSPIRMTGLMMGFWFLATAFADYIAGMLATLTSVDGGSPTSDTTGYYTLFSNITVISVSVGIIVLLSAYWLSKLGKYAEKQNNTAEKQNN